MGTRCALPTDGTLPFRLPGSQHQRQFLLGEQEVLHPQLQRGWEQLLGHCLKMICCIPACSSVHTFSLALRVLFSFSSKVGKSLPRGRAETFVETAARTEDRERGTQLELIHMTLPLTYARVFT